MFFGDDGVSKREAFRAASLDFSDLEAEGRIPTALDIMRTILTEMNKFLEADAALMDLTREEAHDLASVGGQVNSIAAPTHVSAGNGDRVLSRWVAAINAARADENTLALPRPANADLPPRERSEAHGLRLKQDLSEFRAKTGISVLLAACGEINEIDLSMSADLQRFVSGK
jgi:hypothetical protein